MIYLIASDIHGSAYACERLLDAASQEQADGLILLGDILYHGPRNNLPESYAPKQVLSMLNTQKARIICVRGNCDAEVDQMVLDFPIMDTYRIEEFCGHRCFLTHGHHYSPSFPPSPATLQGASLFFSGHTHIPCNLARDGIRYCNPGSVSIPKNNSYPGYIVLSEKAILWKDLNGTIRDQLTL